MSSLGFLSGFLVVVASLLFPVNSHEDNSKQTQKHAAMFVFGDSLYDPGNNNFINVDIHFKANRWPYGEAYFKFPTGRFCDGRIIPDFIAIKANLPLWTPYLAPGKHQFTNGANFASAASGVLSETNPGTISLGMQVNYFKNVTSQLRQELGQEKAKKLFMEAVYLYSTGGNDYQCFYENKTRYLAPDPEKYAQLVIGNLTNMIREIYEMGGRKFAFQNIGPMGCLPLFKGHYGLPMNECLEELSGLATLHNNAFLKAIKELESKLRGFKYSVFDFYNSLLNVTKDPSKYGFLFADVACCGYGKYNGENCGIAPYNLCRNASEYVYFDGAHPTERANPHFAELFWSGEPPITAPHNLKKLFKLTSDFSSEKYELFNDE
ncbi:GDSL lipase [Ricinus communis]|uniref:GDSL lipase n=1 Tax=Ricinus communis TaxID=3988 RepID=UPI00201A3E7C|nr:GDSL lipase [Ricinus communis]